MALSTVKIQTTDGSTTEVARLIPHYLLMKPRLSAEDHARVRSFYLTNVSLFISHEETRLHDISEGIQTIDDWEMRVACQKRHKLDEDAMIRWRADLRLLVSQYDSWCYVHLGVRLKGTLLNVVQGQVEMTFRGINNRSVRGMEKDFPPGSLDLRRICLLEHVKIIGTYVPSDFSYLYDFKNQHDPSGGKFFESTDYAPPSLRSPVTSEIDQKAYDYLLGHSISHPIYPLGSRRVGELHMMFADLMRRPLEIPPARPIPEEMTIEEVTVYPPFCDLVVTPHGTEILGLYAPFF